MEEVRWAIALRTSLFSNNHRRRNGYIQIGYLYLNERSDGISLQVCFPVSFLGPIL
jgi:hypothetical protein